MRNVLIGSHVALGPQLVVLFREVIGCLAQLEYITGVGLRGSVASPTSCSISLLPVHGKGCKYPASFSCCPTMLDAKLLGTLNFTQKIKQKYPFFLKLLFARAFYHSKRNISNTSTFQRILSQETGPLEDEKSIYPSIATSTVILSASRERWGTARKDHWAG